MTESPLRLYKRFAPWAPFLFVADIIWIILAAVGSVWLLSNTEIGSHLSPFPRHYMQLAVIVALVQVLLMELLGAYRPWRGAALSKELLVAASSALLTFVLFTGLAFISKTGESFSRLWIGVWFVVAFSGLAFFRFGLRSLLSWVRARGLDTKELIIVGTGPHFARVLEALRDNPWLGFSVLGYFADETGGEQAQLNRLGTIGELSAYLDLHRVDQVWIILPLSEQEKIQSLVEELDARAVGVKMVPDIFSYRLLNHSVDNIVGLPVINLSSSPQIGLDGLIKRSIDFAGALFGIIFLAPILIPIALAVKCSSPGPVIFRQQRHGCDGTPFDVFKFRTMYQQADNANAAYEPARRQDARVTKVGAILRRTSLDELPQLFNVLMGNMSLVGPRPHPVRMNHLYMKRVDRYMARHKVKPGITGWAQINGYRGEIDTEEKIQARIEYDLYYIDNWSIWLDFRILLLTLVRGLVGDHVY